MSVKKDIDQAAEHVLLKLLTVVDRPDRLKIVKRWAIGYDEADVLRWWWKQVEEPNELEDTVATQEWIDRQMRAVGAPAGWLKGKGAPEIEWYSPKRRHHIGTVDGKQRFWIEENRALGFILQFRDAKTREQFEIKDTAEGKRLAREILREEHKK